MFEGLGAFLIVESMFLLEEGATSVFAVGGEATTMKGGEVEEFFSRFNFASNFL